MVGCLGRFAVIASFLRAPGTEGKVITSSVQLSGDFDSRPVLNTSFRVG